MTLKTQLKFMSVEDYLNGEQHGDIRHEYIAGQVYAMTDASRHHNLVAGALYAALLITCAAVHAGCLCPT